MRSISGMVTLNVRPPLLNRMHELKPLPSLRKRNHGCFWSSICAEAVEEADFHSLHTPRNLRRSMRPKLSAIFDRSSGGKSHQSFLVLAKQYSLLNINSCTGESV